MATKNDSEYSEDEMKFILERALLEQSLSHKKGSREELLEMANRLGIDATDLDKAEQELYQIKEATLKNTFLAEQRKKAIKPLLSGFSIWWTVMCIIIYIVLYMFVDAFFDPYLMQIFGNTLKIMGLIFLVFITIPFLLTEYSSNYNDQGRALKRLMSNNLNEYEFEEWLKAKDHKFWFQWKQIKAKEQAEKWKRERSLGRYF